MYSEVGFAPQYTQQCNSREELLDTLQTDNFSHVASNIVSTRDVALTEKGNLSFQGNEYPVTRIGLESFCNILSIPNVFARKIPLDLLRENLSRLSEEFEKPIRVITRKSDNAIINVTKETFRPVNTTELLQKIPDPFIQNRTGNLHPAVLSTYGTRVFYGYDVPTEVEPEVGDIVRFGRELSNSEVGKGDLKASLFALRLMCTNGATIPMSFGVVRRQLNPNVDPETAMEGFLDSFNKLNANMELFQKAYSWMKDEPIYEDDLINTVTSLERVLLAPEMDDIIEGENQGERKEKILNLMDITGYEDIKKNVTKRQAFIREHPFDTPPTRNRVYDTTYYKLYNQITALPHQFRNDFFRTKKVEALGGKFLQHVLETFEVSKS